MNRPREGAGTLRRMIPYFVLALVIFYAVPFFCKQAPGSDAMAIMMMLLLLMSPGYSLVGGLMYGWTGGFSPWFAVMIVLVFTPSVFVFYNSSALFYVIVFGGLAVAGTALGAFLSKKKRQ